MATFRYLVTDVEAAVSFYTEQLGFTLEENWGGAFAIVSRNDINVWLSGPNTSAAKPMPNGDTPEPGGWNRMVLVFTDVEPVIQTLKQANVKFRNEVLSGPGGKQVLIEDPSGNPIELFQPA